MYKITFVDGTTFIGGEYPNTRWNEIPNKPILSIQFRIGKFSIDGKEYLAYNYCTKINNLSHGDSFPSIAILFFRKANKVKRVVINLLTAPVEFEGHLIHLHYEDEVDFGKEYNNRSTTGWKSGITTH